MENPKERKNWMMESMGTGIVLNIPTREGEGEEGSKIPPRRIRRRLMKCKTPSITSAHQIEAKLQQANLRRQQFHEWLSSKARGKPKSPSSCSSSPDDDHLGQRLQAKLHAAQQKRLSIISMAQTRLARLDQLRQAAKSQVELQFNNRRQQLGKKVESRVHKAELNRMLLLKAHTQRKAALKERTAHSLLQRMLRDTKYKDRVTATIYQKRTAAERKRIRLLEAQKTRIHSKLIKVLRVAKSVHHQRETQTRKMRDQLELRLQNARRQRAEYLRQRGNSHVKMQRQGDILSTKLARCWKQFLSSRKTTFALAKGHEALRISEKSVSLMQFEQFALRIESSGTLQTVKALLDRFENRLILLRSSTSSSSTSNLDNIDHLLKRLASPKRRSTRSDVTKSRGSRKLGSREGGQSQAKLSRYPVRVALCAYMIMGHPNAVFNGQGEQEKLLSESAANFIREFEMLIKIILDGPSHDSHMQSGRTSPRRTFRTQLESFDAAWCSYLYRFVVWKVKDARSLEEDLVRAACQMELSMMQTCKLSVHGQSNLTHDMIAVQKQVTEDQKLLREKVLHLSGDAGVRRMECALSDTRSKYFEAMETGSPTGLPIPHISSPDPASSSVSTLAGRSSSVGNGEGSNRVVRSLFKNDASSQSEEIGSSTPSSVIAPRSSSGENLLADNELLVNEIIHEQQYAIAESLDVTDGQNAVLAKIKETMEKAFWDGIAESLKQDEPNYARIVELVKEVRDELCEMAPQSWKQNIFDAVDLDILSQVLESRTRDFSYLGEILDFALVTLQKLSAQAREDEMIKAHKKLTDELHALSQAGKESNPSFVPAIIRGLRFVLEQTQILKGEISRARIRFLETIIQGSAGFEYLRNGFGNRYGSPLNASTSLPLTVQWLLSVRNSMEQTWAEHTDSLTGLSISHASTNEGLPHSSLRTGGGISLATLGHSVPGSSPMNTAAGNYPSECSGDRVDKMVRLGLLNLTSGIEGITQETVPETLQLNLSRLRNAQAQLQKIIVISTSILVLRQTLLSEKIAISGEDMENAVCNCVSKLNELLDKVGDVGVAEIVEAMIINGDGRLQTRKEVMSNVLAKSLRDGDPVFARVSRAVYIGARGVVFGGCGLQGKELAAASLRKIGAVLLTEELMKAVEILIVVATVSCKVHEPWYAELIKNM